MPQYYSPGVYVEEIETGAVPIQGVSTSVTGAVGVTLRGPTDGKPVLVTGFNEFVSTFGSFMDEPGDLGLWTDPNGEGGYYWRFVHAVKGFFDNGGQQLYVKRVASSKASAASLDVKDQGLISEVIRDAAKSSAAATVTVRFIAAVKVGDTVRIVKGDTASTANPNFIPTSDGGQAFDFTITAYNTQTGTLTFDKGLGEGVVAARGDYVVYKARNTGTSPVLTLTAKSVGEWGNDVYVRLRPMTGTPLTLLGSTGDQPFAGKLTAAPAPPAVPVSPAPAPPAPPPDWTLILDTAGLQVGDKVNIPAPLGTLFKVKAVNTGGGGDGKTITLDGTDVKNANVDPTKWDNTTRVLKVRKANSGTAPLGLKATGSLYANAIVELDNGTQKEVRQVASITGGFVTLTPLPHGTQGSQFYEGDQLRLIEAQLDVEYRPGGANSVPEVSESYTNLRLLAPGGDDPAAFDVAINKASALVSVSNLQAVTDIAKFPLTFGDTAGQRWAVLVNADNGALTVDDFVGVDGGSGHRTGIQALEDIEDISIAIVPGMWSPTVRAALLAHCDAMRYRVAIIDPPLDQTVQQIQAYRSPIDSNRAALYHPWVVVRDPSTATNVPVPPSGHMAGIYAYVDANRGVQKAPANEVIKNILKLRQDITTREQDLLNPVGINALRSFPDRGLRVWGARTVSSDANWRYINVRRIFNFIERSIDVGTQWVVFEPNDQTLWSRVRQTVSNFLDTQWRAGMLEGATAADAFYVKCDRGVTMTQTDIENGLLICEVGIAPVYPAEFVIFRIQKYVAASKLTS